MTHSRCENSDDAEGSLKGGDRLKESDPPKEGDSEHQSKIHLKEQTAGFVIEGNWEEVTSTCTDFTAKLEATCRSHQPEQESCVKEWKDWYPREGDDEKALGERTAAQAKFTPDREPDEHLEETTNRLDSFLQRVSDMKIQSSLKYLRSASQSGLVALTTFVGRSVSKAEEFIYRNIVVRTNPCYFDNSLISASFGEVKKFNGGGNSTYQLTVKLHDNKVKEHISRKITTKN